MFFKTNYLLMQGKNIAEYFLQYFHPLLSYHLSLKSLFGLFLSGGLTGFTVPQCALKIVRIDWEYQ